MDITKRYTTEKEDTIQSDENLTKIVQESIKEVTDYMKLPEIVSHRIQSRMLQTLDLVIIATCYHEETNAFSPTVESYCKTKNINLTQESMNVVALGMKLELDFWLDVYDR